MATLKRSWTNSVACIGAAVALGGSSLALVSCSTRPDRDESLRKVDDELEKLNKRRQRALAACNELPPSEVQACRDQINADYYELRRALEDLIPHIIEEDREEAKKRKEKVNEKFLDVIPSWPGLKDLLLDFQTYAAPFDGEGTLTATPNSVVTVPGSPPTTDYPLAGNFTLYDPSLGDPTVSLSGNLTMNGTAATAGQYREFTGGTLTIDFGVAGEFDTSIHSPAVGSGLESWVETTSTGDGWIYLVLDFDTTDLEGSWWAIMASPMVIKLPITIDSFGVIEFDMAVGPMSDLLPYEPWPASDYDGDGVLNPNLDYAAFMVGFQNQDPLADSDADGMWTIFDVNLWSDRFATDYSQ